MGLVTGLTLVWQDNEKCLIGFTPSRHDAKPEFRESRSFSLCVLATLRENSFRALFGRTVLLELVPAYGSVLVDFSW